MSYLLDTNVLSELRRGPNAHASVLAWDKVNKHATRFTSAIVIAELRKGALSRARKDAMAGVALHRWVNHVISTFTDRILPVDKSVAEAWAMLMVPDPRSPLDTLIAATALAHELTLVTRNVRDFTSTGIELLDPWVFAG